MENLLTKEAIIAADDLEFKSVDMREFGWPGKVRVGLMSGAARDRFEQEVFGLDGQDRNMEDLRARLVALTLYGAGGKLLFDNLEDIKALSQKSSKALNHLFDISRKLNGVLDGDTVDTNAKNS